MNLFTKLISGFLTVSILAALTGYWGLYQLGSVSKLLNNEVATSIEQFHHNSEANELVDHIKYVEEILVQSARNFAFTRNKEWEQRYFAFLPDINASIQSLIDKSKAAETEMLYPIQSARASLAKSEIMAIKLVNQGDIEGAVATLEALPYRLNILQLDSALAAFQLVHRGGGQGTVPVRLAARRAQIAVEESKRISLLFIAAVVLTAAVISVVITRSITRPILRLAEHIRLYDLENIGEQISVPNKRTKSMGGHLLARWLPQLYRDETTELATSFNKMSGWLAETVVSRDYVGSILASVSEGIVTTDGKGLIMTMNAGAKNMFGYGGGDVIGVSISKLLLEDPSLEQESDSIISKIYMPGFTNQNRDLRLTGCRKDGSHLPVEVDFAPMKISGQSGFVSTIRDVTERSEIDQMKGEFVATVSHELRTPLTSIKGSLGMIEAGIFGEMSEKGVAMIKTAQKNTERLIRLVSDILDVEKMEVGSMDFSFNTVNLADIVKQSVEDNKGFAEQQGVVFELKSGGSQARVKADANRVAQVIANLLSNAAKFSPVGGKVEVSIINYDDTVRVCVTDYGPGIPDDFRDKIFGRFAQADSTDVRQQGGTGLGLNISKSIIERHGGRIGFDTEFGVGTTFHFDLPELTAG